ncbi:MAG: hypothetical protein KJO07_13475 [Deltaproteobacteria bacterium]|nr:hypothetical protein [Deltaproteobacteria bacterium]
MVILRWLPLAIVLGGCTGDVGRIDITLVTAPGDDPLASAELVRLRLSNPELEVEQELDGRTSLSLDIEAREGLAFIEFEAEDAGGELVALGRSPVLPLSAIDFELRIFVAPPWSIREAAVAFESGRAQIAAAPLSFGAALIGGLGDNAQVTAQTLIYNAFQHDFQAGVDLPEGRAAAAALADSRGIVYVFGGTDQAGDPRPTTYRFNTNVAPGGSYSTFQATQSLARAGADLAALGPNELLIAGGPLGLIDAQTGTASPLEGGEGLSGRATSFALPDELFSTALVVGLDGAALVREREVNVLSPPAQALRTGHQLVLSDQLAIAVGGEDDLGNLLGSAVTYDPLERSFAVLADFLAEPRSGVGAAVTTRYLVVAGGRNSAAEPSTTVEVFDRTTLESVRTLAMISARAAPNVVALGNGQVLIAGGFDADGMPIATLELVTMD